MVDTLVHLFTSGAYLPFALLLIYFGLRLVLTDTHWLAQGRLAVIAAAVLAGLSQLVPVLLTGQTPNLTLVMTALGAAWALYVSPHPQPAAGAPKAS